MALVFIIIVEGANLSSNCLISASLLYFLDWYKLTSKESKELRPAPGVTIEVKPLCKPRPMKS
jgi:hypothetical protein